MIVEVVPQAGSDRWITHRVFLSAHCHGRSDGNCRWYGSEELGRFRWVGGDTRGAPIVWVASGKHGGYPSRGRCDTGHRFYDSCDRNTARVRFPVRSPRQNIGSRARPFAGRVPSGCASAADVGWGSRAPDRHAVECPWRAELRFRGWQTTPDAGASSYERYLREQAGF